MLWFLDPEISSQSHNAPYQPSRSKSGEQSATPKEPDIRYRCLEGAETFRISSHYLWSSSISVHCQTFNMAIFLFKFIRRKLREREAQKAVPTTDDSHLVPEYAPGNELQDTSYSHHHGPSADSTGSHIYFITPEEAARQKGESRRRSIRQLKLMLGLALPNFLAAMDVTIVAPAIPLISSHFGMSVAFDNLQASLMHRFRPTIRKLQLDCCRIHTYIYHVCASFWTARRNLWSTLCATV
jgi:hypothetical protein